MIFVANVTFYDGQQKNSMLSYPVFFYEDDRKFVAKDIPPITIDEVTASIVSDIIMSTIKNRIQSGQACDIGVCYVQDSLGVVALSVSKYSFQLMFSNPQLSIAMVIDAFSAQCLAITIDTHLSSISRDVYSFGAQEPCSPRPVLNRAIDG